MIFTSVVCIFLRGCRYEYTQKNALNAVRSTRNIAIIWNVRKWTIVALAERFLVSRRTIDEVIERVRKQEFAPRKSTNKHFLQEKYGMKRLAKVEVSLENQKNCGLALLITIYTKSRIPLQRIIFITKFFAKAWVSQVNNNTIRNSFFII